MRIRINIIKDGEIMEVCKYCGGIGKLNKRNIKDLQTMIYHTKCDLGYGKGGSFVQNNSQNKLHKTDIESVKRAVNLLSEIIKAQS
jgi:hypothetical protein